MATMSHSSVAFTGASASDLLRSSSNGVSGIPLKALGRARFSSKKRDFSVVAKVRKVKKHEYPWPEDPDPNVKGGVLFHLSHFKPLKEKPKPVTLDFEKPLVDLEKKIIDVKIITFSFGLNLNFKLRVSQWLLKVLYFFSFLVGFRCGRWRMKPVWTSVIRLCHWRINTNRFD